MQQGAYNIPLVPKTIGCFGYRLFFFWGGVLKPILNTAQYKSQIQL
jgi:hypothetical protein